MLLLWLAARLLLRRRGRLQKGFPEEFIDLTSLDVKSVRREGPVLEFYNVPVRLVLLVLAPAGRGGGLPPKEGLPQVIEALFPGMMDVLTADQPLFRQWPEQLSSAGFARAFFKCVPLPGDRGKGSPFTSAAGRLEADGRQLLVGLVCCADKPNSLGQHVVDRPGQWLDILRVRGADQR